MVSNNFIALINRNINFYLEKHLSLILINSMDKIVFIYIIKLFAYMFIYLYIYMSAIAGQTAGPNGLTFFERTLKYSGGNKGYKKFDIFFKNEKILSTGFFYKNRFF